jgi:hypothetical protein
VATWLDVMIPEPRSVVSLGAYDSSFLPPGAPLTRRLRVERYCPHWMATPVRRLVDDAARGALRLTP